MKFFTKLMQSDDTTVEPSVVITYSIEDTPGRTFGVKIPRASVKTARRALLAAHRHHDRRNTSDGDLDDHLAELLQTIFELDKTVGKIRNRNRNPGDHYFLGQGAEGVNAGLTVGAEVLNAKFGKEILSIRGEVLTNHQFVDVHRTANRK